MTAVSKATAHSARNEIRTLEPGTKPKDGIEPSTSFLPRTRSATELLGPGNWSIQSAVSELLTASC